MPRNKFQGPSIDTNLALQLHVSSSIVLRLSPVLIGDVLCDRTCGAVMGVVLSERVNDMRNEWRTLWHGSTTAKPISAYAP